MLPVFVAVVVVALAVAVADGAVAGGACTVGWMLDTTGDGTAGVATDVVTEVIGAAALWFREQPVTSAARIAPMGGATK